MELYTEDCSLSMLLDIAASIARPLMSKNNNQFFCHLPDEPIMMHVDQTRFNQIMLNLLSNAAKFTKKGAITILSEISTIKGKTYINIHVEDTGIGLSQEQLLRLFRDYSQADTSISSRFGGTGLGLALSKRLACMMGGDIFVNSTPGSGSCFTLQLPLAMANDDVLPQVGNA